MRDRLVLALWMLVTVMVGTFGAGLLLHYVALFLQG